MAASASPLATARAMLRAAGVLAILCLAVRGAVGIWLQFTAADPALDRAAPPIVAAEPGASTGAAALSSSRPPAVAAPITEPAKVMPSIPWRVIESSAGFVEGQAGPVVAALVDMECAVCSQLWRRVRAPIAAGRLRVRWIPVAVVSATSAARGAALLRAPDPVAAFAAHESRAPAGAIHASEMGHGLDDIAGNTALLSALTAGRPATPVLVAMTGSREPELRIGMPADLDVFLARAR